MREGPMKPGTSNSLSSIVINGCVVLLALWLGKGQIAFIMFSVVLMYFGRILGWWLSKASLYKGPTPLIAAECIIWGGLIAYLIHALIAWHHPHWVLKSIFGFALGAYVSIPNYGLVAESTLPLHAIKRHDLVSSLPLGIFVLSSIGYALLS